MTTTAPDRRIDHLQRALTDLAAAHGEAMANTTAAVRSLADIARAAMAVASKQAAPLIGAHLAGVSRARILAQITERPGLTTVGLLELIDLSPSVLRNHLVNMHHEELIRKVAHFDADGARTRFIAWAPGFGDDPAPVSKRPSARASRCNDHAAGQFHHRVSAAKQLGMQRMDLVAALFGPARAEVRA